MMYCYAEKYWQLTHSKLSGQQYREQSGKQLFITLNKLKNPPQFKVSVRSIRDRYTPLTKKFRKRMTSEQKSSGISPEMCELDVLMEEFTRIEDLSEEVKANKSEEKSRKTEQDRVKAIDMRKKGKEKLSLNNKQKAPGRKLAREKSKALR